MELDTQALQGDLAAAAKETYLVAKRNLSPLATAAPACSLSLEGATLAPHVGEEGGGSGWGGDGTGDGGYAEQRDVKEIMER